MYQKQRKIKKTDTYISLENIFSCFEDAQDVAFLHSSLQNSLGRYSILGLSPYLRLEKDHGHFKINGKEEKTITFEAYVKKYLDEHVDRNMEDLPIVSGAIGYFSYDYGREQMRISSKNEELINIPEAILVFYDVFLIEDGKTKETWIVANGILKDAKERIQELEKQMLEEASRKRELRTVDFRKSECLTAEVRANFQKEDYKMAVEHMIQYIIEGDIYIANMTQQLTIQSKKAPVDVFYELCRKNPSPFGGYFDYGDFQIVSASPERFLRMKKGHVETRPIKGTRKRGETMQEDQRMRLELENSEKDKSELLMIVDLERNDLNRVCKAGSVRVTELFTVEEYATVFHLVSNIEGTLDEGKNFMDLVAATFPGGSITGAPKYRAMEIIDELEHGKRNLYTGSMGYLTLDGDCDFNIVIRTVVHKDQTYCLGVGGGITAESELEFEYEETLQKAKAILDALDTNTSAIIN